MYIYKGGKAFDHRFVFLNKNIINKAFVDVQSVMDFLFYFILFYTLIMQPHVPAKVQNHITTSINFVSSNYYFNICINKIKYLIIFPNSIFYLVGGVGSCYER